MPDQRILPQCSEPVNESACWLSLLTVAESIFNAHRMMHGLPSASFHGEANAIKTEFLYAALHATGLVDQVRRDVARHHAIQACERTLADRFNRPVSTLTAADHHTCRFLADSATIAEKFSFEGLFSHQATVRSLVARIQALRPKVQIAATVEPGGETRMLAAEVM